MQLPNRKHIRYKGLINSTKLPAHSTDTHMGAAGMVFVWSYNDSWTCLFEANVRRGYSTISMNVNEDS